MTESFLCKPKRGHRGRGEHLIHFLIYLDRAQLPASVVAGGEVRNSKITASNAICNPSGGIQERPGNDGDLDLAPFLFHCLQTLMPPLWFLLQNKETGLDPQFSVSKLLKLWSLLLKKKRSLVKVQSVRQIGKEAGGRAQHQLWFSLLSLKPAIKS